MIISSDSNILNTSTVGLWSTFNTMKSKSAGRPRTMSEVLLNNKKSRMDNLNASPSQLSSHAPILQPPSQQVQPPSQPLHPPLQDTHVTRKRKVGRPRSQSQQQQVSTRDTTHPTFAQANMMSNSCDTGLTTSKSSGSKRGRGKSLGIKGCGSGNKLKVQFDVNNKPLEGEGNSLTGQLGIMVRNSYRVPQTFLNWKSVPNHIKEGIWKEVQDNLEFCPDEYESVCMDSCCRIYKDNKAKINADHYTPYMFPDADPNIAFRVPDFVDPDQWKELVEYWQIEELAANGESLDKMSVYLQTQKQDNPEVKEMMFPDTTSGHRTIRDQSIGGDTPTLERGHRTPTRSPGPIEQVSYAFCFMNPPLVHAPQPSLSHKSQGVNDSSSRDFTDNSTASSSRDIPDPPGFSRTSADQDDSTVSRQKKDAEANWNSQHIDFRSVIGFEVGQHMELIRARIFYYVDTA
ncbi:hypothetical protein RHMOL_Rhmol10G0244500 [Rhododendron molle]|uniref:Uncharacterized protein n=1 Tax=Rhododendron molle TaxID=49168 RepID=A0ACC0M5I2_RHOML|nr:hypothetical protein RHMOL_Rhmol10G0244500 [Rhododendron molle]